MSENKKEIQVALQRIFLSDLSFESPDPVACFKSQWQPQVNLDVRNKNKKIEDDVYQVSLEITATVKNNDKTAFIIELEQSGIFTIRGIDGGNLRRVLGTFCMNILFPYARESIDSMCLKGSFPPLVLAPINFEQLYEQSLEQNKKESENAH
jgi:preprotein translocase subunit SecB